VRRVLLVTVVGLLALAAGALADSKMAMSGGVLDFRSEDAGISNDLSVRYDSQGRIRFFDETDPYGMSGYPSPPCSPGKLNGQGNAVEVFCDKAPVKSLSIEPGPGQDTVVYRLGDRPVTLDGGLGADLLETAGAADTLNGDQGNDDLDSGGGNDSVSGGDGRDSIHSGEGADSVSGGLGSDAIDAGGGNDNVDVADGIADSVACGPGTDTVSADQLDQLGDCEDVTRVNVDPPADQPQDDDSTAPTLTVRARAARVSMKHRSVAISVRASEQSLINVSGFVVAGGINSALKKVRPGVDLGEGGIRMKVGLSKGQLAKVLNDLRRHRRPKLRVTVSAVDPAGNTSTPKHLTIALKR
jgi:hypothetical protein